MVESVPEPDMDRDIDPELCWCSINTDIDRSCSRSAGCDPGQLDELKREVAIDDSMVKSDRDSEPDVPGAGDG